MIQYKELEIPGVWLLTPQVFGDERGSFTEILRFPEFAEKVSPCLFIQENESFSTRGVLRGLHLQHGSAAQAKLVRCIHGEVIDECHLYPFDPEIGVDWLQYGVSREQLILSPKDLEGSSLQQYLRG